MSNNRRRSILKSRNSIGPSDATADLFTTETLFPQGGGVVPDGGGLSGPLKTFLPAVDIGSMGLKRVSFSTNIAHVQEISVESSVDMDITGNTMEGDLDKSRIDLNVSSEASDRDSPKENSPDLFGTSKSGMDMELTGANASFGNNKSTRDFFEESQSEQPPIDMEMTNVTMDGTLDEPDLNKSRFEPQHSISVRNESTTMFWGTQTGADMDFSGNKTGNASACVNSSVNESTTMFGVSQSGADMDFTRNKTANASVCVNSRVNESTRMFWGSQTEGNMEFTQNMTKNDLNATSRGNESITNNTMFNESQGGLGMEFTGVGGSTFCNQREMSRNELQDQSSMDLTRHRTTYNATRDTFSKSSFDMEMTRARSMFNKTGEVSHKTGMDMELTHGGHDSSSRANQSSPELFEVSRTGLEMEVTGNESTTMDKSRSEIRINETFKVPTLELPISQGLTRNVPKLNGPRLPAGQMQFFRPPSAFPSSQPTQKSVFGPFSTSKTPRRPFPAPIIPHAQPPRPIITHDQPPRPITPKSALPASILPHLTESEVQTSPYLMNCFVNEYNMRNPASSQPPKTPAASNGAPEVEIPTQVERSPPKSAEKPKIPPKPRIVPKSPAKPAKNKEPQTPKPEVYYEPIPTARSMLTARTPVAPKDLPPLPNSKEVPPLAFTPSPEQIIPSKALPPPKTPSNLQQKPQIPPKSVEIPTKCPKTPSTSQEKAPIASTMAEIPPKTPQSHPKAFEEAPMPSKVIQEASIPPKSVEIPPKSSECPSKVVQDPQILPKTLQLAPKAPELPPKAPELPPKAFEEAPLPSKIIQEAPILRQDPQIPPKTLQLAPKAPELPQNAFQEASLPRKSAKTPSKILEEPPVASRSVLTPPSLAKKAKYTDKEIPGPSQSPNRAPNKPPPLLPRIGSIRGFQFIEVMEKIKKEVILMTNEEFDQFVRVNKAEHKDVRLLEHLNSLKLARRSLNLIEIESESSEDPRIKDLTHN